VLGGQFPVRYRLLSDIHRFTFGRRTSRVDWQGFQGQAWRMREVSGNAEKLPEKRSLLLHTQEVISSRPVGPTYLD